METVLSQEIQNQDVQGGDYGDRGVDGVDGGGRRGNGNKKWQGVNIKK